MIDFQQLEGIVSAIEGEAKQPSPSHANLARLVAMFFRLVADDMTSKAKEVVPAVAEPEKQVESVPDQAPEAEPEQEPKPTKHLKKQKGKKS